jgi:cobalt/nickel transport protein
VSTRRLLAAGVALSLLVAGVLSYFASARPDGLEHVAADLGFASSEQASAASGSPLAGYSVRGVSDGYLSGGLAGVVGLVVVGLVMTLLVLYVRRRAHRERG